MPRFPFEELANALADSPLPSNQIAREARVSTQTLTWLRQAKKAQAVSKTLNPREQRAKAQSLTRLASYLQVDITAALDALRWLPSGQRFESQGALTDPLLRSVTSTKRIRVGFIWSPKSSGQQGVESPLSRFLDEYADHLMEACSHKLKIDRVEIHTDVASALEQLTKSTPSIDCLIGLSDLPSRRKFNVRFVRIPGLHVPLSMIYNKAMPRLRWRDVLVGTQAPNLLTIGGDIGERVARNGLGLATTPVDSTLEPEKIANGIIRHLSETTDTNRAFVADQQRCFAIKKTLDDMSSKRRAGIDFALSEVDDGTAGSEPDQWTPWVDINLAVRGDSPIFATLMEEATRRVLFGHAVLRTALTFAELAVRTHKLRGRVFIRRTPLVQLADNQIHRFRDAMLVTVPIAAKKYGVEMLPKPWELLYPLFTEEEDSEKGWVFSDG